MHRAPHRPTDPAALAASSEAGRTTSVARAALAYLASGWSVVPVHTVTRGRCSCGRRDCPSPGKHPRVRWQRFERERPSAETVTRWWQRWPDTNVGVVTGRVSGIVVLDVDPRNGGEQSLSSLEARWAAHDDTVESSTGSHGGRHLWFACREPVPSGPLLPGVDLKGEGGLVVAPPSVHASGKRYAWRPGHSPDDLPLASPPDWLRTLASPDGHEPGRAGAATSAPARTPREQREFAETWARAGVELRSGDHNYLCPFHDDHHPSLHVDAEGCRWMCFGCGRRGGIGALRRALGEHDTIRSVERIRTVEGIDAPADTPADTLAGDVEIDVVGESAYQDTLLALTGGRRAYGGVDATTTATLTVDPAAPLDPDAVEVRIGGHPVGWLRRADARRYRTVMSDAAHRFGAVTVKARITGGWDRGRDDVGAFGVRVRLPRLDGGR